MPSAEAAIYDPLTDRERCTHVAPESVDVKSSEPVTAASLVPSDEEATMRQSRLESRAVHVGPAGTLVPAGTEKLGASFTPVMAMVKVVVLVSTPPPAVPPLSWATTVTVAVPKALAAGVKVSVPFVPMAGWALKRLLLSFVTV